MQTAQRAKCAAMGFDVLVNMCMNIIFTQKTEITIDTLSGIKMLRLFIDDGGKVRNVAVDMGAPVLEPQKIPVAVNQFGISNEDTKPILLKSLMVGESEYKSVLCFNGKPSCYYIFR